MDAPKTLASGLERAARLSLLSQPHMQPLAAFVAKMREAKGADYKVLHFDPLDGGTHASVLFLLEAPGPKAVGSGFVSRNNPDETAKNFFLLNEAAGIDRRQTIIWNAVPWYIGSGTTIRPAKRADVSEANQWLEEMLVCLRKLEIVVFVGKKALHAQHVVRNQRPSVQVFYMPHPSPVFVNRAAGNRQLVLNALRQVSIAVSGRELPAAGLAFNRVRPDPRV